MLLSLQQRGECRMQHQRQPIKTVPSWQRPVLVMGCCSCGTGHTAPFLEFSRWREWFWGGWRHVYGHCGHCCWGSSSTYLLYFIVYLVLFMSAWFIKWLLSYLRVIGYKWWNKFVSSIYLYYHFFLLYFVVLYLMLRY